MGTFQTSPLVQNYLFSCTSPHLLLSRILSKLLLQSAPSSSAINSSSAVRLVHGYLKGLHPTSSRLSRCPHAFHNSPAFSVIKSSYLCVHAATLPTSTRLPSVFAFFLQKKSTLQNTRQIMAPQLVYWDLRGLGEPIRFLLNHVGEEFEDKRYTMEQAPEYFASKPNLGLDFPNLPYLIDGDVKITQSMTILRYLARKHGLMPSDPAQLLRCELVEQQLFDMRTGYSRICYNVQDFEKLKAEHVADKLPGQMEMLSKFLGDRKWLNGDSITYVDFLLYEILDIHRLYQADCLDKTQNLKDYCDRFEALPNIAKYMSGGKFGRWPINGAMAAFGGKKP